MPVISTFFGITIRMYYREHDPAHFHAEYQGQQATFSLNGAMLQGEIRSGVATRLIREWALLHQAELGANWERILEGRMIQRIEPLE